MNELRRATQCALTLALPLVFLLAFLLGPLPFAASTSASASASSAASARSGDWPGLNGPGHDRGVDAALEPWPAEGPTESWRAPARTGFSSYCIAGERVFTLERREGEEGEEECLIARSARDGSELWVQPLGATDYDGGGDAGASGNKGGDGPRSTPTYHAGRVYTLDAHFVLACFGAEEGELLWRVDLRAEHGASGLRWGNAASPVLAAGKVWVAGGGQDRSLLAFDQESGSLLHASGSWRVTHSTPVVATIHGIEQVVFLMQEGPVALACDDGRTLWHSEYPYKTSSAASPVVWEDLVYVSAAYGVGAGVFRISPGSGEELLPELLWQKRNKLQNHWSTPLVVDGKLYGLYGFKKYGEAPLACVDMATGEPHWEERGFGPGGLIRVGKELIVLGDSGQLVRAAVDPTGYRELGRVQALEGKCWSSPAFSGGRVFVRSTSEGACFPLAVD